MAESHEALISMSENHIYVTEKGGYITKGQEYDEGDGQKFRNMKWNRKWSTR